MKSLIRDYALRLKDDCEDWHSPVPYRLRIALHEWGKRLYCATYGLTPARVDDLLSGVEADAVDIIHANRCRRNYGETMNHSGTRSIDVCMGEPALLSMMAYHEMRCNWRRMLSVNGIHVDSMAELEDSDETAERYNLPKGTRFYYIEPDEPEED